MSISVVEKKNTLKKSIGSKKFYIETYGCDMNKYDSLITQKILKDASFEQVGFVEKADFIFLNTCAIRENAHRKIYNRLDNLKKLHKKGTKNNHLGCMAQNLKKDLLENEALPIDHIVGPDSLRDIKNIVDTDVIQSSHIKLSKTEVYEDIIPSVESHLSNHQFTAFLSIQRGCDNFCSFCVVPFTRGRERSRSIKSIVQEVQNLEQSNFKSVVLLGQNVNSYKYKSHKFVDLVQALLDETNIPRIYFTSPHPKDFPIELIELMAENKRFCNHVHIPLQSGNNTILRKMRRSYTHETFIELVHRFRNIVPNVSITTDVIVGFPSETEEQFQDTLDIMQVSNFDSAFMFAYSERKGTLAQKVYKDDVPEEVKKNRLQRLITEQLKRSLVHNKKYIGRKVEALIEGVSRRSDNDLIARLLNGKKLLFTPPTTEDGILSLLGLEAQFEVYDATSQTLKANYISSL